jgi:hypothetical protein
MHALLSSFAVSYTGMFAHRIVTLATALVNKIESRYRLQDCFKPVGYRLGAEEVKSFLGSRYARRICAFRCPMNSILGKSWH